MQKYEAGKPASMPCIQNDSRTPSDTFAPGPSRIEIYSHHGRPDYIEHRDGGAAGVERCLANRRGASANKNRRGHTLGAIATDVAGDFAAAGRVTDMDRLFLT